MTQQHKNSQSNPHPFPQIDQQQSRRQLAYLNFKPGNLVYLRFFYHSDDPRKNDDKGRKLDWLHWKEVEAYQRSGRGVYVVVNGAQGGHEDKDIKECAAIFCEWDDRPVEEQLLHWETVGFLEPTFTVYSGDKSAQPYWVFDEPIAVEQWRELQCLLIEVMGADPSNKNPSRVFRLAGGWHVKPGREPRRTEIVQDSGIKYSYFALRDRLLELKAEVIPAIEPQEPPLKRISELAPQDIVELIGEYIPLFPCGSDWKGDCPFCNAVDKFIVKPRHQAFECLSCKAGGDADNYSNKATDFFQKYQRTNSGTSRRIHYKDIQVPVQQSVPLFVCLSKQSRSLLWAGVSQGSRNTRGAKLARDLIGTANYLQSIGQRFDGDPRQLLDEYASRCTPPLPPKEVDAIWFSAEKDHPTPSCTPEGVEACVTGWYWNNYRKPNQPRRGGGSGFGSGSSSSSGGDEPPIKAVSLCDRVAEILHRYDSQSMRDAALMDLAAAVGRNFREVEQLAKILLLETELSDDATAANQSLGKLLKTRRTSLNPHDYFESWFAEKLQSTADAMPTAVEFLITTLLPVAAACIGTSSRVVIKPKGGYVQPLIIWSAIVGQSGGLKTPAQKAIIKPLMALEALYYQEYQEALKAYNQESADRRTHPEQFDGEPELVAPRRRRLVTKDCTIEKLQRIHGDNPRGLLYYRDELAGGAKSRNQYRGGKGADYEAELDQFNGAEIIYDRGDKEVFLSSSCVCRTGGYQWEVAAQMMDENGDFTGMNARWLLDAATAPKPYIDLLSPDADTDTGLSDALSTLYKQLVNVPTRDYLLSHEAKVLFQAFQHQSVDDAEAEEKLGLQVVYPKNQSYVARLALLLHIVNATLRGESPDPVISGDTMRQAISLAGYYLWQYRMIYKHNNPDSGLEGLGLKVHRFALKAGRVSASLVKRGVAAFRKVVTGTIRSCFESLAASGWGRTQGEGASMVYIPYPESFEFSPQERGRLNTTKTTQDVNRYPQKASLSLAGNIPKKSVDVVDAKTSKTSTAVTPFTTGIETGIDGIDEIDESPLVVEWHQPDEQKGRKLAQVVVEGSRENHQFINSESQMPVEQERTLVDADVHREHQLSTGSELNSDGPDDSPLGGDGGSPVPSVHTSPSGDDGAELLDDEEMAAWHQSLNACQTLEDAMDFHAALDALSPQQRNFFESSVPQESWTWLWNLPEVTAQEPEAVPALLELELLAVQESEFLSEKEPTLEELKALLVACEALVQLNELKRKHRKTIAVAYNSMSDVEQAHVDALAALAVPYRVFKYVGESISQGTERLIKGTLVYLDPQTQVRANAYSVPVWAIDGVASGQRKPINVTVSLMREVVKALLPTPAQDGNTEQLGLI